MHFSKVLLVFVCFNLATSFSMASVPFTFTLQLTHFERSKDSNTRYEHWSFSDGILHFEKRYSLGKFKNKPPVEKQKTLSEAQIMTLQEFIVANRLLQTVEAPKHSDFKSPYTAIDISWNYKVAETSYSIQLYDTTSELQRDSNFKDIQALQQLLEKLVSE